MFALATNVQCDLWIEFLNLLFDNISNILKDSFIRRSGAKSI
jgi:hypothetical protein